MAAASDDEKVCSDDEGLWLGLIEKPKDSDMLVLGPVIVSPPAERLDTPELKDAIANLVHALAEAASIDHSGAEGGRFSHSESSKLSAASEVLAEVGLDLAATLGKRWGHEEGAMRRRLLPGVFMSKEPSRWNYWQTRLRMDLKESNTEGTQYFCLFLLLSSVD